MLQETLAIYLLLASLGATPNESNTQIGWWSQYAENPTLSQIQYHGFEDEQVDGFVAVLDCDRVGQYAWITINDSPPLHVRVFDCLGTNGNLSWWRENNIIGEIDYYLAEQYDVVGQGGVRASITWEVINGSDRIISETVENDGPGEHGRCERLVLDYGRRAFTCPSPLLRSPVPTAPSHFQAAWVNQRRKSESGKGEW